tara:strand:- start:13450 stop:16902 length:3453 start_codon:yes stop_codon:yes gene_type:complete
VKSLLFIFTLFLSTIIVGQNALVQKNILLNNDTIVLDENSIVPGSFSIKDDIDTTKISILPLKSLLIVKDTTLFGKSIRISYRTFGFAFYKPYYHKSVDTILKHKYTGNNPFVFRYNVQQADDYFSDASLNKSGNISRGVMFGNNQDLSVNSNFNLQLNGKISDDINIKAVVSDNNIPIQPDGNTQQLQDFDQVYIQLYNDNFSLTAGDYFVKKDDYFLKYNKRAKGGLLSLSQKQNNWTYKGDFAAAVSKGKFARNVFFGIEGNQGPYRLKGAENETFIIVLAGTEKVYLDGKLLERGQNYDYVINYNTAEVTFTPNNIITQNSRIIVEFQYSDKNYARMLLLTNQSFKNKKWNISIDYFNEQDAKNQPLQQELNDTAKAVLAAVGDSLNKAVVNNIKQVDFSDNQVLYKMTDTTVNSILYDSVFVYSTNPDSAIYRVGFSYVGENKGDYVQIQSVANGKVFQWVAPIGGIPQGNYAPVAKLISPKKLQVIHTSVNYKLDKGFEIGSNIAVSDYDKNTFSDKDDNDNTGIALMTYARKKWQKKNKTKTTYILQGDYEWIQETFTQVQRIRNAEFQRDWNLPSIFINNKQEFYRLKAEFSDKKIGKTTLGTEVFNNYGMFHAVRNYLQSESRYKTFHLSANGSFLQQTGNINSNFLRHYVTLSKRISDNFLIGVGEETEQNYLFDKIQKDSILGNSFDFFTWKAFLGTADSLKNAFKITYLQRQNKLPYAGEMVNASFSEDIMARFIFRKLKNQQLQNTTTYRTVTIQNNNVYAGQNDEQTILSKTDYSVRLWKGFVSSSTVYQIGSGLEVKKEYSFIEVTAGQGNYAYIGDINGNGVKDLNEFEPAVFSDEAKYIKVFTPTNEYVKVYRNVFSQSIYLSPRQLLKNKNGPAKFIGRFSSRTNWSTDRKTADDTQYFNPAYTPVSDSNLISINALFNQRIYFNKTSAVYALDYGYTDNKNKNLLTNGFEARNLIKNELHGRWNVTKQWTAEYFYTFGTKSNFSELFANKNYFIRYENHLPKITYQYGSKFRVSIFYEYKQKINEFSITDTSVTDKMFYNKIGMESRLNLTQKGSILAQLNYINIDYSGQQNQTLQYEMLEGLQNGINATWMLGIQRNLSKHMQLNINYQGRTSENAPVIHIGNVQIRAYF